MKEGRVFFQGTSAELKAWLESFLFICPANFNVLNENIYRLRCMFPNMKCTIYHHADIRCGHGGAPDTQRDFFRGKAYDDGTSCGNSKYGIKARG